MSKRKTPISYSLHLQMLKLSRSDPTLERVLEALGVAILKASNSLDKMNLGDEENSYIDGIVDMETTIIENLLGAAFISCQAHISTVVTFVMNLNSTVMQNEREPIKCCGDDKASILGFGQLKVGKTTFAPVQIIDAAANYYKHNAEWEPSWEDLQRIQRKNAEILAAVGAKPSTSGIFRHIASSLGNSKYHNTKIFVDIVSNWQVQLESSYKNEMVERGLIKTIA